MSVSANDIIIQKYDPQYSLAGAQYARNSLLYTYNRMGLGMNERMNKIVIGIAFEMAFKRWLDEKNIAYEYAPTPFTEQDRADLSIAGKRCDLKSFLLPRRNLIPMIEKQPGWLLDAPALVPLDQFNGNRMRETDLYVFGFITGMQARTIEDTSTAIEKTGSSYLLYIIPDNRWNRRSQWESLGHLAFKSNNDNPITIEVGGLGANKEEIHEEVVLQPRTRTPLANNFYSILYIHAHELPEAEIGLSSSVLRDVILVHQRDWTNIWLFGRRLFLCGWASKADFREWSEHLPAGSRTKQYSATKTHNRAVPIANLRPMHELVLLYT
jgi:hypothetical protein